MLALESVLVVKDCIRGWVVAPVDQRRAGPQQVLLVVRSVSPVRDWIVRGDNAKNVSKAVRKWRSFIVGGEVGERFCQWARWSEVSFRTPQSRSTPSTTKLFRELELVSKVIDTEHG